MRFLQKCRLNAQYVHDANIQDLPMLVPWRPRVGRDRKIGGLSPRMKGRCCSAVYAAKFPCYSEFTALYYPHFTGRTCHRNGRKAS
jgi:hypothetical protein